MDSTPTKSPKDKKEEDIVKDVLKKFNQCWRYCEKHYHEEWDEAYKLYNNQRLEKYRSYRGTTDTFVPMTRSTIETILAELGSGAPRWEFIPQYKDQNEETEVLNALIDQYYEDGGWYPITHQWIKDMLLTGTGVLFAYWNIDRPEIMNIPIRDVIFDVTATNPEELKFAGRRFLTTKEELESFEAVEIEPVDVDGIEPVEAEPELKPIYKNLDKIKKMTDKDGSERLTKAQKEMFMGSNIDETPKNDHEIEVIEIWTKDRVQSIANRSVLIRDEENPYKVKARLNQESINKDGELEIKEEELEVIEGIIPFIFQRNTPDSSLLLGESEITPFKQLQELLNDTTNQRVDIITDAAAPTYTIDPNDADHINEIDLGHNSINAVTSLQPVLKPQLTNGIFNEGLSIKDEIRETSAASEILKGVSGDQQATLGEKQLQLQQSGNRFSSKVKLLEKDGFHRLAKLLFRMIQLNVDQNVLVRVAKSTGTDFEEFDPALFVGEYSPRVSLDITVKNQNAEKAANALQMYQMLAPIAPNPDKLNQILLPKIGDILTTEEVKEIFAPPEGSELGGLGGGLPQDPNAQLSPEEEAMAQELAASGEPL